ncbi:MAG: hypothetical protein J7J46_02965 [Candidatus Desulfofervidus sp.]|nr:hypothetical protein [Candidatus Desulfofervidus sp.]
MSYTYENLTNNLVYHMLMTAINGMQIFGLIYTQEEQKESKKNMQNVCLYCHSQKWYMSKNIQVKLK